MRFPGFPQRTFECLRPARRWAAAMLAVVSLPMLGTTSARAQSAMGPNMPDRSWVVERMGPELDMPGNEQMKRKRIEALNQLRQKRLVADTNKLLKLAEELNASGIAGHPVLSPAERLRKLAQIEKLAKSVREKMSYSVVGGLDPDAPFAVFTQ